MLMWDIRWTDEFGAWIVSDELDESARIDIRATLLKAGRKRFYDQMLPLADKVFAGVVSCEENQEAVKTSLS